MVGRLVSVIMPVYNGQNVVSRCINSILAQTYKNIEYIIVNDGSKDNSAKIVDEYAHKDNRISVIHQQNKGASGARNTGLDACTGDYIVFVDADDFIHADFIKNTLELSDKYDADIVQTRYDIGFKSEFGDIGAKDDIIVFDNNNIFVSSQYKTVPWGKLYRKYLFDDVRYPKNNVIEDEAVLYRIYYYANRVVHTQQKLYYAFMSKGSLTRSRIRYDMRFIDVFKDRIEFFQSHDEPKLTEIAVVKYALALSIRYMRSFCSKKNTKDELNLIYSEFERVYKEARNSEYISKKHKAVIRMFNSFPRFTAIMDDIITRIRRKCGSY